MKRHLNTLYVTTQDSYIGTEGETLVVRVEKRPKLRVPFHMLEGVVAFGRVGMSPIALGRCATRNVNVSFLTERGRFLARVVGPASGNVLLRRTQFRWADDPNKTTRIASAIVAAKIANCKRLLRRGLSDHGKGDSERKAVLDSASKELDRSLAAISRTPPLDMLRGIEGNAARVYFSAFGSLITNDDPAFRFERRSRRPPLDPVNALLSFLYTLLRHDVESALSATGLDTQVGFLHRDKPGRPGLALDMMEELRPLIADRVALSLINRQQLSGRSFVTAESGAVALTDGARTSLLKTYQERKTRELKHPFLEEKMSLGIVPHIQALLLARHLRGDLETYPPFFWR